MAKHKQFTFKETDFTVNLTFKKAVTEKKAIKLTSLLYWIASEAPALSKNLKSATIEPS